ncbi:MAG: M48 family metalloprotease [Gammaproteobacteria bacterium]|nr:M48 family metalloprotease [Gammaproteobacteria bacterium]
MKKKPVVVILWLILGLSGLFSGVLLADRELPLLGANASINLKKEVELGEGLYNKLKEKGYVIEDPLLSRYLQDIGESLLSALEIRFRDYHFFLVKDSTINAFAAPGGYIGVNAGLIAVSDTEDELASVLAHEIAHVELMHSMQMLEKASEINMASLISVLAAILVGSQNPDMAGAILYGGIAGSSQAMINFTRANEYEADRVGVELLKQSKYDPDAMADFMGVLQKREQNGEIANIEYFRTHPVSSNRIAEIRARLDNRKQKQPQLSRYQQFRDYLFYLYPFDGIHSNNKSRFSQALVHTRNGRFELADQLYQGLTVSDPDSLWYKYALAENMEFQGRISDAAEIYQTALLLYPDELSIGVRLVAILLTQKQNQKALNRAMKLLRRNPGAPQIYQSLVKIYGAMNDDVMRQFFEAHYHWYSGNRELARTQFKALLSQGGLDASNELRVKEKLDAK